MKPVKKLRMNEGDFDLLFRQGGRRIAPGIWIDRFGDLHWSVPELLALVDLPDTPENREAVAALVQENLREAFPDVPIVVTDPEDRRSSCGCIMR